MTDRFDLTGEVAVIIGGTGSLGGAIAQGLAEAGSQVIILGRNESNGEAKATGIRDKVSTFGDVAEELRQTVGSLCQQLRLWVLVLVPALIVSQRA